MVCVGVWVLFSLSVFSLAFFLIYLSCWLLTDLQAATGRWLLHIAIDQLSCFPNKSTPQLLFYITTYQHRTRQFTNTITIAVWLRRRQFCLSFFFIFSTLQAMRLLLGSLLAGALFMLFFNSEIWFGNHYAFNSLSFELLYLCIICGPYLFGWVDGAPVTVAERQ